jgi:hypothetical protein
MLVRKILSGNIAYEGCRIGGGLEDVVGEAKGGRKGRVPNGKGRGEGKKKKGKS